mmetsp:Transcript_17225/g.29929  ORF Transcript_17225/g.29929 Transcript_17225/m.29929 type:complete len:191 (-) Transcript_17225:1157-1729(-)
MNLVILVITSLIALSHAMMDRSVSAGLFCAACKATVTELEKELKKRPKRSEGDVMTAIEEICTMQNFKTYAYIPPKMIAGCEKVLEYDEPLEKLFMQKPHLSAEQIIEKFCNSDVTSACVGIDDSNPQNEAPKVYMDGEEVQTNRVVSKDNNNNKQRTGDKKTTTKKKKAKKSKKNKQANSGANENKSEL